MLNVEINTKKNIVQFKNNSYFLITFLFINYNYRFYTLKMK